MDQSVPVGDDTFDGSGLAVRAANQGEQSKNDRKRPGAWKR